MLRFTSLLLAAVGALASIDNSLQSATINAGSTVFPYGFYYIKNVNSGNYITYAKDSNGHNFYPAASGYPIEFQAHNSSTAWTRLRPDKVTKCPSAQWNSTYCNGNGCDWASVLYACAVDPRPDTATLEYNKQFWLFMPRGTSPESYNIIALDHLTDMATRGWNDCTQVTGSSVQSTCIDTLDYSDNAFAWYVLDASGNPVSGTVPSITVGATSTAAAATTSSTATAKTTTATTAKTTTAKTSTTKTTTAAGVTATAITIVDATDVQPTCSATVKTVTKTSAAKTVTATAAAKTVTRTATKTAAAKTVTKTVTVTAKAKFIQANVDFDQDEWEAAPVEPVVTKAPVAAKVEQLPGSQIDFTLDDSALGQAGAFKWVAQIWRRSAGRPRH